MDPAPQRHHAIPRLLPRTGGHRRDHGSPRRHDNRIHTPPFRLGVPITPRYGFNRRRQGPLRNGADRRMSDRLTTSENAAGILSGEGMTEAHNVAWFFAHAV